MTQTTYNRQRRAMLLPVIFALPLLLLGLFFLAVSSVRAATFEVDTTVDDPGLTACTAAPNDCSLRGAISAANALGGPDDITLPAGDYVLTFGAIGDDANAEGDLDVLDDLTITGAGAATTIIRNGYGTAAIGDGDRVLQIDPAGGSVVNLTLDGVTIRDADLWCDTVDCDPGGAAIDNAGDGDLTIRNSDIVYNTFSCSGVDCGDNGGFSAAGINSEGLGGMFIYTSTIAYNLATCSDPQCDIGNGAIAMRSTAGQAGEFILQDSTLSHNVLECIAEFCTTDKLVRLSRTVGITITNSAFLSNTVSCTGAGCNADELLEFLNWDTFLMEDSRIDFNKSQCIGDDCDSDELFADPGATPAIIRRSSVSHNTMFCSGTDCDTDEVIEMGGIFEDFSIIGNDLSCIGLQCDIDELVDSDNNSTFTRLFVDGNSSSCDGEACDVDEGVDVRGTIADSTITDNSFSCTGLNCVVRGGAVGNRSGFRPLLISGTLIANNSTTGLGGGVTVGQLQDLGLESSSSLITVTNSTISGNTAEQGGGIGVREEQDRFSQGSTLNLYNVTVTDNTATSGEGDGLYTSLMTGTVTLTNTIIADQAGGNTDCFTAAGADDAISGGHNLDSDGSCNLTGPNDISSGNANLGPLADNGGPTETHALLDGSDALNAGDDAACAAFPVLGVDQRGVTRPQDGQCDIGAYERVITFCPIDDPGVGNELTTLLGTGMGSPTRSKMVAKDTIPNANDVTDLYGQMAGKEYNGVRYVRFIFGDKSYIQVQPETDLGDKGAISWWGADLTTEFQSQNRPFVKGRWFLQKGMKKMRIPRAIVFYATNQTVDTYANNWSTFTYPDNFVAGTPGFDQTNTNVLPIPETVSFSDVVVQLAVTDVNRDPRTVDVIVRAGGVEETVTLSGPTNRKSELLNLFEVTLPLVPPGVDEVEIELVSVLDEGDSAALLGASASYVCEQPAP